LLIGWSNLGELSTEIVDNFTCLHGVNSVI